LKKKILWILVCLFVIGFQFVISAHSASLQTTIRIGLVRHFSNVESINIRNTTLIVGHGFGDDFIPSATLTSGSGFVIRRASGNTIVQAGGSTVFTFNPGQPAQITAAGDEFIQMGTSSVFRGYMEFVGQGSLISAVNVLSMEEYLFGVLPAEMSPSFHPEALKAQAVAARTFAYNQMETGRHTGDGFDICDSTHCQVFNGAGNEHENTNNAVMATAGLRLFYDGVPILANFFSSSGGSTDNSEDVWFEARPYLRSVNSAYEHEPLVWTRTFTWEQLTLAANSAGANIGVVSGFSISRISVSGNALEITLHGSNGNHRVVRESIRSFFGPIGGHLPSRAFTVAGAAAMSHGVTVADNTGSRDAVLNHLYTIDSNGVVTRIHLAYLSDGVITRLINSIPAVFRGGSGITVNGRGHGHLVGMSQRGAEGMARAGYTFMEILKHYYTGVEVRH